MECLHYYTDERNAQMAIAFYVRIEFSIWVEQRIF